jgi:hypothetical protein
MSDDAVLEVGLPLDADGFLRRECPTCERELKWRHTPEGEDAIPPPLAGYYCPYCGVQASPDTWFTPAQAEYLQATAAARFLNPQLNKLSDRIEQIGRSSGGLISVQADRLSTDDPKKLIEIDDMRPVDFSCHPEEPVKVMEDWSGPVLCIICGLAAN